MRSKIMFILVPIFAMSLTVSSQEVRDMVLSSAKGKKVALLIGNSDYGAGGDLGGIPRNDAQDLGEALESLGFRVTTETDLPLSEMKSSIRDFKREAAGADVALVYYAGHGIQIKGENYLVPIGAEMEEEYEAEDECLRANRLLSALEASDAKVNLVILDACRNNPFERAWNRSTDKGLVGMGGPTGSLIAFATSPGDVAKNRAGRNSPYTSSLIKQIKKPGIHIEEVFSNVRREVYENTDKKQTPWVNTSILGKLYLNGKGSGSMDRDGDGVPDAYDKCPDTYGTDYGCPEDVPVPSPELPEGMVLVRGGSFTMGCTSEQGGDCYDRAHKVTLSDYYMAEHEVTVEEYLAFCNDRGSNWPEWLKEGSKYNIETGSDDYYKKKGYSRYGSEKLPIVGVSWDDAVAYCEWKSGKEGRTYRLPTEAEWEYAARGGEHKEGYKYSGGSNLDSEGWYSNNSGGKPHPVGLKKPNALGIYDMSGNVWEWCSDWYGDYSSGSQTNPKGPSTGSRRVYRGGSWGSGAGRCRVAYRGHYGPGNRNYDLGFRVVSSPVRHSFFFCEPSRRQTLRDWRK
jgi:formylglycine-generating enzyme required for sulfatase activity